MRASYYRARYYDAQAGRFLSEDLFRYHREGPNLYMYVGNSPGNLTDPLGLWPGSAVVNRIGDRLGQTVQMAQDVGIFWGQFGVGAWDMWNNYEQMEGRNWKGADKYYHCMANCQAVDRGSGGALAATVISFFRTDVSSRVLEPSDWRNDDKANKCGQKGGDCNKRCAPYIPKSSPGKPGFPGW